MPKKDDHQPQTPHNNLETDQLEEMRSDLHRSEAQTRKRINRLDAAISHLYKVVAPLRQELSILERKRLAIEKLLFERYGKIQRITENQISSGNHTCARRKSDQDQIKKAAAILGRLSPEDLQALLERSSNK